MAKSVHDDVLDGALDVIKNNASRMVLCSAEPTRYTEANATYMLTQTTMTGTDFTISNGDTNGRKVRVAAKTSISPTNGGTANHVALLDVANSKLLLVTTMPSKTFTTSDLVDTAAWDYELAYPT